MHRFAVFHDAPKGEGIISLLSCALQSSRLNQTMMEMSREMMKAGIIDEMMSDAIDGAVDSEDMEAETEEEVDRVRHMHRLLRADLRPEPGSCDMTAGDYPTSALVVCLPLVNQAPTAVSAATAGARGDCWGDDGTDGSRSKAATRAAGGRGSRGRGGRRPAGRSAGAAGGCQILICQCCHRRYLICFTGNNPSPLSICVLVTSLLLLQLLNNAGPLHHMMSKLLRPELGHTHTVARRIRHDHLRRLSLQALSHAAS
jgi:Snf7